MNRPDPRGDLMGYLDWLGDRLEALEKARGEEKISAGEAARRMGRGEFYFRGKPWRVPGFGRDGTFHPWTDWQAWHTRPEAERRAEWDSFTLAERRRIRGDYSEVVA